jgi:hypothetical protein
VLVAQAVQALEPGEQLGRVDPGPDLLHRLGIGDVDREAEDVGPASTSARARAPVGSVPLVESVPSGPRTRQTMRQLRVQRRLADRVRRRARHAETPSSRRSGARRDPT